VPVDVLFSLVLSAVLYCALLQASHPELAAAVVPTKLHFHIATCAVLCCVVLCSLALSAVLYCVLLKASHPELAAAAAAERNRGPKQLHSAAEVVAAARKRMSATWQQGVAHMGPGLQVCVFCAKQQPCSFCATSNSSNTCLPKRRRGAMCACCSQNPVEWQPETKRSTVLLGIAACLYCCR
jgi:hypothetical protein